MAILGKERFEDLEAINEGITGMLEIYKEDPASRGMNAYLKAFSQLVENLCRPFDDKQPVVWYNLGMSPELILALDGVHNIPIEAYPALQDIIGDVKFTLDYIDRAEAHGLPPRGLLGGQSRSRSGFKRHHAEAFLHPGSQYPLRFPVGGLTLNG